MLFLIRIFRNCFARKLDIVAYLTAENLALRQQLIVLKRNQKRPSFKVRDREFWKVQSQVWPCWRDSLVIVQPETVIGWQRRTFRFYWRCKSRGANQGRPKLSAEVKSLVLKLSAANPLWGAPRIHGELLKLGIEISERSVSGIIRRNNPKPPSQTWKTFIKNHMPETVAVDFLVVPTIRFKMLFVFVVLSHARRRVIHFNVTANPTAQWTAQQITEAFPWDSAPRYLLRDRDKIFGNLFQQRVCAIGIEEVLTAYHSPWQNAYVERLNGSIRRECTDHIIVWNERHLKRILRGYFDYHNNDRTHLGLAKETPVKRPVSKLVSVSNELLEMPRVGGLHHRYEWREAA
ncbi:MAG TPA: integrase [Gammaproteobacteria bacterium]|nr:integrase [Gammaproteobacteria bacterium]